MNAQALAIADAMLNRSAWGTERIESIVLRRIHLPLKKPYVTAYATFSEFEPIIVETRLANGRVGWGEGQIAPGSSRETRQAGWRNVQEWAKRSVGTSCEASQALVMSERQTSPVAATSLITSLEMACGHPLLERKEPLSIPLLVAISATEPRGIEQEVEAKLAEGFRTFKVKVGPDVEQSLSKLRAIQSAVRGRATLRLDANRSFTRDQAIRFATGLDPVGIELFEQPCAAEAWDDNGAVARQSPIPLMLDEAICSIADIERAGAMAGVAFCKLKLKRFGSLDSLATAMQTVIDHGMRPVLGDGLSSDLGCWMEACAGSGLMHGAGEFNGFLKPLMGMLNPTLTARNARLELAAGYSPLFDASRLGPQILETREVHATSSLPQ